MKITCLMDNVSRPGLECAHGLSLWVEACSHRFLFDLGPDAGFIENAKRLGIDVSLAEFAVLSHAHDDHGGGLAAFLELCPAAPVYLRRGGFEPRWSRPAPGVKRNIGLDPQLADGGRIIYTGAEHKIAEGLTLFSGVRGRELFSPANRVLCGPDGETPDDFSHEQNLLIEEDGKRVLIDGCAHCGILNILSRCAELCPQPPQDVVGGFHLMIPATGETDDGLTDALAERLAATPTRYHTGHCTGVKSYERLRARLGSQISYLAAGDTLEL